ncbi:hypothetical protein [Wolbachia endosymbiont (group A) of Ennomos erosarius]|uniref:hypothetical protein n=1 Tax=Wolbachia endosymbiont (group A) of Ennomos erosarius TaxID=3066174 RepID=UPI00334243E2
MSTLPRHLSQYSDISSSKSELILYPKISRVDKSGFFASEAFNLISCVIRSFVISLRLSDKGV